MYLQLENNMIFNYSKLNTKFYYGSFHRLQKLRYWRVLNELKTTSQTFSEIVRENFSQIKHDMSFVSFKIYIL